MKENDICICEKKWHIVMKSSRMKTAREEGLEEGRKEGKQLFLQCIRLKKQGFSKEKIAEECQVDIPEVEEILKEIEDL